MRQRRRSIRAGGLHLAAYLLFVLSLSPATAQTFYDGTAASSDDRLELFRSLWQREEIVEHPELAQASLYELRLVVSADLNDVSASLRVRFTNRMTESLPELRFLCYPNLTSGSLDVATVTVAGRRVQPEMRNGGFLLIVPLPTPLLPLAQTEIGIEYSLRVPQDPTDEAGLFSHAQGILSLGHAYPMLPAPQAWFRSRPSPYGDFVTNEVSFYIVRVELPDDVVLIAPGVEIDRTYKEGRTEVLFIMGPARDLYLAAGRDLVVFQKKDPADTVVRSVGPRGGESGAMLALRAAEAALTVFSRRFGAYPFTTLTVVSAPLRALGVEFSGIVLVASRLYDPPVAPNEASRRFILEGTVAHEIAHQWFYGVVGTDQRMEPWIDESLAQYAFWLYFREIHGDGRDAYREFEEYWNRIARAEIPIGRPVAAYTRSQYGAIIYGRAPLFLLSLAKLMGEDSFDRLLSVFVERYRWRLVDGERFRALAEQLCQCEQGELDALWARWVRPQEIELPLLRVPE